MVLGKLGLKLGIRYGRLLRDRKEVQWNQSCIDHQKKPIESQFNHHRIQNTMRGYVRPVANHRRKHIDKTHTTSNLQSSEEKGYEHLMLFT